MPPVDETPHRVQPTLPKPARRKPSRAPRTPMPQLDPLERAQSFDEVALGYTEEQARAEAERCLQCKNPTCIEGCPVNIDIKSFIARIIDGDYHGRRGCAQGTNSLPAVCGRVCPQEEQCESACVLAKKGEPVAIGRLERFLGDYDLACEIEHRCKPEVAPATGKRCAVVGSGPAGLACARELARLGHEVTVLESLHAPGGVLTYGIPEFRLPKAIVETEIEMLERDGRRDRERYGRRRDGHGRRADGRRGLRRGVHRQRRRAAGVPGHPGREPQRRLLGQRVPHAREPHARLRVPDADTPVWRGRKVAVVGGGNVAMDAARTALRLGAEEVFLVYRRTEDEMPARREEVHHAREEGIEFKMLCSPQEILGRDGFVTGMVATRMELGEPDESGRRAPVCIMDSEFAIECDTVIMAVGTRANPLISRPAPDLELTDRGYIV